VGDRRGREASGLRPPNGISAGRAGVAAVDAEPDQPAAKAAGQSIEDAKKKTLKLLQQSPGKEK